MNEVSQKELGDLIKSWFLLCNHILDKRISDKISEDLSAFLHESGVRVNGSECLTCMQKRSKKETKETPLATKSASPRRLRGKLPAK